MPASKASRLPWKSWKPISGSTWSIRMASGSCSATASTSIPPIFENIAIGFLAERSNTKAA